MIAKYRVFVALSHPGKADRYSGVIVDLAKSTKDNRIIRAAIGEKSVRENITYQSLIAFYGKAAQSQTKPDYVISNVPGFTSESIYFSYNSKDDHRLVMQYVSVFDRIMRRGGTLQSIVDNTGFYLHQTEGSAHHYVIDVTGIEMPTLATMLAIDEVLKNKVSALLEALKE